MYRYIVVLLFVFIILLLSCNTTEPPPPEKTITLTLEDAASVEAWIKLTTTNLQLPAALTLKQSAAGGNTVTQDIILSHADTLLYIDSLLPNTTYTFHAAMQPSNQAEVKSNVLSVATMDTTSHNFTFETFTFGEHSSSVLFDVAIIDENNIWAVGEIYMNDSLGQPDPEFYNLVKWDGSNWNIQRIKFTNSQGQTFLAPIKSVFAFNENDIWLGMDQMIHWNGNEFIEVEISSSVFNSWINKIWGTSNEDLYVVGNNGNIAHYSGPTRGWQKIESGTELNIGDIWGIQNSEGVYTKYCAADNAMLIIDNGNILSRINVEPGMFILSVWGISDRLIYTAGGGVVLYKNYKWEEIDRTDVNTIYRIRGQNYNDVFGISSTLSILHFNGYSWQSISMLPNNVLLKLEVKDDLVAVVGRQGDAAAITIIRRN